MNSEPSCEHFFPERLLPAVTVSDPGQAVEIAEALLEGGLSVMEITFRTAATMDAIQAVREEVPGMLVGAGTILTPGRIDEAMAAGAQFGLSPGLNRLVVERALERAFPFVPGVSTPSEIEEALGLGMQVLKIFPAEQLGGPSYLRSLQGPYAHTGITFIPMGGVNLSNLANYSRLKIVRALGGSWLVPKQSGILERSSQIIEQVRLSLELLEEPIL